MRTYINDATCDLAIPQYSSRSASSFSAGLYISIGIAAEAGRFFCLSDYVLPAQNGKRDHLVLFVVTAGEGVRERSEKAKNDGYYFKSHGLQALAIETAEGCAEWLHRRIREDWGF